MFRVQKLIQQSKGILPAGLEGLTGCGLGLPISDFGVLVGAIRGSMTRFKACLLYTSDAADE